MKYRTAIEELEHCTGKKFTVIHIVGGGVRDSLLCSLTASYCKRKVTAGPVEATAFGNAAVQLLALGEFSSEKEARECIARSEENKTYFPEESYEEKYESFKKIISNKT